MTDLATGLYAHGAIMAALLQRHRTGRGVHIDCNLLSSQSCDHRHVGLRAGRRQNNEKPQPQWIWIHVDGFRPRNVIFDRPIEAQRLGESPAAPEDDFAPEAGRRQRDVSVSADTGRREVTTELFRPQKKKKTISDCIKDDDTSLPPLGFKTKDGHIVIAAGNDKQFVKVCQEKTADWLSWFEGSGVPVGPINSIQEVFSDPQITQMSLELTAEHNPREIYLCSVRVVTWLDECGDENIFLLEQIKRKENQSLVKLSRASCDTCDEQRRMLVVKPRTQMNVVVVLRSNWDRGPAVRFSSFAPGGPTPPPLIGQHTVQVLRDTLSYGDDAIEALLEGNKNEMDSAETLTDDSDRQESEQNDDVN
ncbi:hypothetical protein F2P81_019720 [Scophthalmus maximus]|uniref:Uncharacterized protein n=1 Tax=Scophthalmus maximus TaxID=52904 RepID=A0A6A4S2Q8_SCOMX|nr:hypothetical protein F2P81_019720 [Scophthalmus maximus]